MRMVEIGVPDEDAPAIVIPIKDPIPSSNPKTKPEPAPVEPVRVPEKEPVPA